MSIVFKSLVNALLLLNYTWPYIALQQGHALTTATSFTKEGQGFSSANYHYKGKGLVHFNQLLDWCVCVYLNQLLCVSAYSKQGECLVQLTTTNYCYCAYQLIANKESKGAGLLSIMAKRTFSTRSWAKVTCQTGPGRADLPVRVGGFRQLSQDTLSKLSLRSLHTHTHSHTHTHTHTHTLTHTHTHTHTHT